MTVTIKDIARHSGVSVSTVSRVLNKKPDVNSETETRVNSAIKELGYSPNSAARGLVLKRSNAIGFVVPDITNPNFPELARGVVIRAKSYGYSVMFFDTNNNSKIEKEAIRLLKSKQVDGIILSFGRTNKDELKKLKMERFPVVQIYRKIAHSAISTIAINNVDSGYTATMYLLKLGHRRIGHITTGSDSQSGRERLDGYKKALAEMNIHFDSALVQTTDINFEGGRRCMERLLEIKERPTAVFASHDMIAIGAYEAIYNAELSIPGDISIVGHDNIEMSKFIRPKLTTVDTHKGKLGEESVDLLMEEIKKGASRNRERVFNTELIIRESASLLK